MYASDMIHFNSQVESTHIEDDTQKWPVTGLTSAGIHNARDGVGQLDRSAPTSHRVAVLEQTHRKGPTTIYQHAAAPSLM